jgi:signal transduction histidine kinase
MKKRAANAGAELEIQSGKATGTRLCLHIKIA